MNDAILLKTCERRENYYLVMRYLKKDLVDRETYSLLEGLGEFYNKHPETDVISFDDFSIWFTTVYMPDIKNTELELYKILLGKVNKANSVIVSDLISAYIKKDVVANLQDAIHRNKPLEEMKEILEKSITPIKDDFYVSSNLHDKLDLIDRTKGLRWHLEWMNEDLAPLIMGDFGLLAGMVEAGKTSFVASQVVYMAEQLPEDKQVLWFVNEGYGRVTLNTLYQTTFKITSEELSSNTDKYMELYKEKMGRLDKIQVIDCHDFTYREIESIIKKFNVGLIVIDMMDNVRGFISKSNQTSDYALERLYQWGRNIACKVAPVLVTSQFADLSEFEKKFPPLEKFKGSRVAKQGTLAFALTLGMDTRESNVRYIGCVKNKLRSHNRRYFKRTINFDVERVHFT